MSIRSRLTGNAIAFTRSELKIVRELLANYPAAGLTTVAQLAAQAKVSDPTVLRFVGKLGFAGFPAFQGALLAEVEERMRSPLSMMEARRTTLREGHIYRDFLAAAMDGLASASEMVVPADFEAAADMILDDRYRAHFLGGRFSRYLAAILRAHVMQMRPGTFLIEGTASDMVDAMADIGPRDVLVVFDYRRYQVDVIGFARTAARQGARVLLFTDPWRSPIADLAETVLVAPVETISPFDTMVPALAQTEAFVAALTARIGEASRRRLERIEANRTLHGVTVDEAGGAGGSPAGSQAERG